ncbi:TonB-dependent receptor domain-containing protein [Pleionea sp. CnH1-48]|uniref:TonB-dependent receptor family protein n=1 Tax=Pleionea sp. CnH1-48 TaxID=2954494 RepID=UPI00209722C8|nr:TonB-dependent receptor [Pleionea sp. CnH1-48]MCO7223340.1 TonB-dependent receptor [Pleionea sp. CnH1-48]
MNTSPFKLTTLTLATLVALNAMAAEDDNAEDKQAKKEDAYHERMTIIGQRKQLNTEAGSATVIDEAELEKYEYDDIHRILATVPGVNIRQEDGFGLRPNIGFRGVTPERSKKINILEDGVLIGPAPYSAPAAYYFPMVSRLSGVEVFKGPAAILYGPNTVAGTLNLQTRGVPQDNEGMIDIAGSSDGYQKAHAYVAQTSGNFGVLLEGLTTQSDGFKELDGGGDSGFEKNDVIAKLRYNLDSDKYQQVFELKLGYADEVSNETYLGLTDADFAATPYRRYAASQLGLMDWEHSQVQFNHFIAGKDFDLTTRIYRNNFDRAWRKLNNFRDSGSTPSLQEILQDPITNDLYYQVLTGQQDNQGLFDQLLIGTNDRSFYSQGIQSDLRWEFKEWGITHNFRSGIRFHQDEIERVHTEDSYNMVSGRLSSAGNPTNLTTANTEESKAISWYAQDTLNFDKLEVTLGLRGEYIDSRYQNNKAGQETDWLEKQTTIWLPGASVFYSLDSHSGLFAGVHRGFIPTSPKQGPDIKIEESVNFELGYRYQHSTTRLEVVGFISDFENLKESCTLSTSSDCVTNSDQEFNAGKAKVDGVEISASHRFDIGAGIDLPISFVYTYNNAEFEESFESTFELWGNVTAGNPIPYLPENQMSISLGLESTQWRFNLLSRYIGEMWEAAGSDVALSGVSTEAFWVLDVSAAYDFDDYGTLYLKVDNLTDEVEIVSRRPFGARPSKPQQFFVGYKYRW